MEDAVREIATGNKEVEHPFLEQRSKKKKNNKINWQRDGRRKYLIVLLIVQPTVVFICFRFFVVDCVTA